MGELETSLASLFGPDEKSELLIGGWRTDTLPCSGFLDDLRHIPELSGIGLRGCCAVQEAWHAYSIMHLRMLPEGPDNSWALQARGPRDPKKADIPDPSKEVPVPSGLVFMLARHDQTNLKASSSR